MARIIIAAIVGGLIVFVWSFVSHTMLPIANMGMHIEKLTGEESLRSAMTEHLPESGLYLIPGMDPRSKAIRPNNRRKPLSDGQAGPSS